MGIINMNYSISRKLRRVLRNIPNLFEGYNIYVKRDKLDLINLTFSEINPKTRSFADLGGVWKVNAAYCLYTLKNFQIDKGILVDTDFPQRLVTKLQRYRNLQVLQGDFADRSVVDRIGHVDVIFFFDVLLHQANPDWDQVIERYASNCSCFVVYNQQFVRGEETIRLTNLPFEEYIELASDHGKDLTHYIYEHKEEIHPKYKKPWKDIHNITQWGITDRGLRQTMSRFGFREVFYKNYGMFLNLPAFENHAFVFMRR
jgi:hypothetical protein